MAREIEGETAMESLLQKLRGHILRLEAADIVELHWEENMDSSVLHLVTRNDQQISGERKILLTQTQE